MWGLKCFRKCEGRSVLLQRLYNQVFQYRIFLVDGRYELLKIRGTYLKTDATDAITLFKSKDYSLFVSCSNFPASFWVRVLDDERKRR